MVCTIFNLDKASTKKAVFSGFFYFADRIFIIHLFFTFSFLSYGITYMVNKSYIDKPYNKGYVLIREFPLKRYDFFYNYIF